MIFDIYDSVVAIGKKHPQIIPRPKIIAQYLLIQVVGKSEILCFKNFPGFHKLLQAHVWLDFMTNISYPFILPDWVWITKSTIFGMMNTARQELGFPVHVLDIAWEPKCKCWPG